MKFGLRLLTPLVLVLYMSTVSAQVEQPRLRLWPDEWVDDINKTVDRSGSQLTNVIFDAIDKFAYTITKSTDFRAKLGIQRTVFDNQDVLGTWTVSDTLRLEMGHDKAEFSVPLGPSFIAPLAFKLGINGAVSVSHVRQVKSYLYHTLDELNQRDDGEVQEQKFKAGRWLEFDPSSRPRMSNIWNPVLAGSRIPFTKKSLARLAEGDLVSYSTSGYISTGLELGLVPIQFHKDANLNLSVGAKVFVAGEFRITVLKESARYVRVKVTKSHSRGTEITAGSSARDIEIFEGFTVFEKDNLARIKVNVTPFKFSVKKERKKQFDLGFRYDMNDEDAVAAYEDAVVGQFKESERLSKAKKGVTHILTRESLEKSKERGLALGVDWLAKTKTKRRRSDQDVLITTEDGKHKIFKSSTELSRSWSTVWGDGERKSYNFITLFDQDAYARGEVNSFQLVTEGLIEDVRTSAEEMSRYTTQVVSIIGNKGAIPELPVLVPHATKPGKFKNAKYKRSSFYFGQFFTQKQVIRFIKTPEAKARIIAFESFNNPRKFLKRWMQVQESYYAVKTSADMIKTLSKLTDMFKVYGGSLAGMRAILASLEGDEIDYFLTANNNSFGRIQLRGKNVTNAEKLLNLADSSINFENTVGTSRPDPLMVVKDFKATQEKDQRIKITFNLPKDSKYVFFRVLRSSGWKQIKNVKELIFFNKNKFNEGMNEWYVSADSTSTLEKALYEAFTKTEYYTIQLSTSQDRFTWGRTVSSRFLVEIPEVEFVE